MYKTVLITECTDQIYIQGDSSCFIILISVSLTTSVVVVSIFFFSLQLFMQGTNLLNCYCVNLGFI